ncbi:MAG: phosphatidylglycerophosphatase A [Candidatus Scalindua sp.]|nr:phosphatidylglycerophosphatase A [Candidatus Scalindua sp.]
MKNSLKKRDPGFIVVDEVVGQWIALLPLPFLYDFLTPYLFFAPITGIAFFTFRLFDIWKPWPVNYVEKQLPGGLGIMIDDVIAGIYALITTTVVVTGVTLALYILYPAFLSHYFPEK